MGLLETLTGGASAAGDVADKLGGRALRGALGGKTREIASVIPFSDSLGITDAKDKVSGRDLTDQFGVTSKGDGSLYSHIMGGVAEAALDPLAIAGAGLAGHGAVKFGMDHADDIARAGKAAGEFSAADSGAMRLRLPWHRADELADSVSNPLGRLAELSHQAGTNVEFPRDMASWEHSFRGGAEKSIALYDPSTRAVVPNTHEYPDHWSDPSAMADLMREKPGWFSTDNQDHVSIHEIGHALHHKQNDFDNPGFFSRLGKSRPIPEAGRFKEMLPHALSDYGSSNPAEFVAEEFARTAHGLASAQPGRSPSSALLHYYQDVGGPDVPAELVSTLKGFMGSDAAAKAAGGGQRSPLLDRIGKFLGDESGAITWPAPERSTPGYVNGQKWFHGTNVPDLTPESLDAFKTANGHHGPGVYMTSDPLVANHYATRSSKGAGTPTVYQAGTDFNKILDLDHEIPADGSAQSLIDALVDRDKEYLKHYRPDASGTLSDRIARHGDVMGDEVASPMTFKDLISQYTSGAKGYTLPPGATLPPGMPPVEYGHIRALRDLGVDAMTTTQSQMVKGRGGRVGQTLIGLDPNDLASRVGRPGGISRFEPLKDTASALLDFLKGEEGSLKIPLPFDDARKLAELGPENPLGRFSELSGAAGTDFRLLRDGKDWEDTFNRGGNALAKYDPFTQKIIPNTHEFPDQWANRDAMKEYMESASDSNMFSTGFEDHPYVHEIGHALHHAQGNSEANKALGLKGPWFFRSLNDDVPLPRPSDSLYDTLRGEVSGYGAANTTEFAAEEFAKRAYMQAFGDPARDPNSMVGKLYSAAKGPTAPDALIRKLQEFLGLVARPSPVHVPGPSLAPLPEGVPETFRSLFEDL